MHHKQDNDTHVFFYENEFYPLSMFSAFAIQYGLLRFDTAEALYHWHKFQNQPTIQTQIIQATSAHEAFKIAQRYKDLVDSEWTEKRIGVVRDIQLRKVKQHPYVEKKLLETGDRILVEDSWRDSFWGWGQDGTGENMMGRLWMETRDFVRSWRAAQQEPSAIRDPAHQ